MAKTVRVTAAEYAAKHQQNTNAAQQYMIAGINRVTEAPGMKAAAQADAMLVNITQAITSGKWARRVASVPLEEWKKDMLEKGVGRVSAGLLRAQPKIQAFAEQLITHQNTLLAEVDVMPTVTLDDGINKMVAWARGMAKFEQK